MRVPLKLNKNLLFSTARLWPPALGRPVVKQRLFNAVYTHYQRTTTHPESQRKKLLRFG